MLAAAALFLLPTGPVYAKVVCDAPLQRCGAEVTGLPATPRAREVYTVALRPPAAEGIHRAPALGLLGCEREPARLPRWFEGRPSDREDVFEVRLSFPDKGRWRAVVVDLNGMHHDLGFLEVAAGVPGHEPDAVEAASLSRPPAATGPGQVHVRLAAVAAQLGAASLQ